MKNFNLKNIRQSITAGLLGLALTACSGGGGGGDGGGGGTGGVTPTPTPASTGVFTDALVGGVAYETETRSGFTNSNGEYDYVAGETVTFSIGGIVLGTTAAGPVVTPLTLVDTSDVSDPQVTNIVRLLLTLDADGNPDNGIEITDATRTAAAGVTVDFNVAVADFTTDPAVTALVSAADTTNTALVDSSTAQTHLSNTLASSWGLMDWGSGQWSAN